MTLEEIKLRRLMNQHLVTSADKMTVVRDLCGVQAQFFPNALHSLKIRCGDYDEATAGEGLVKNWTIRGTVHVFAEEDLPLFIRPENYRRNVWDAPSFWNQRPDWALTPARQAYFGCRGKGASDQGGTERGLPGRGHGGAGGEQHVRSLGRRHTGTV